MKENLSEKKDNEIYKESPLILVDYLNELQWLKVALDDKRLREDYKDRGREVKTVEERIAEGLKNYQYFKKEDPGKALFEKYGDLVDDKYFKEVCDISDSDFPLFLKKKQYLNNLVKQINQELRKKISNEIVIKKNLNEMYKIIRGSIKYRPLFPEVEK